MHMGGALGNGMGGSALQHHAQQQAAMMNMNVMNMGMFGNPGMGMRNPNLGHQAMLHEIANLEEQHHNAVLQQARANQQNIM
jgi:hypothetical protein